MILHLILRCRPVRFVAMSGTLLAACITQSVAAGAAPLPVWPAPPEPPRIAYVQAFAKAADLDIAKGFFTKLFELIAGASDLRLVRPMAVAVTADGMIYVADPGSHGVHRFDIRQQKHALVMQDDKQPLPSPVGLAVDAGNNVYVTDSVLGKIFIIRQHADIAEPLPLYTAIQQPTGIAVAPDGSRLYVADTTSHQVKIISKDGSEIGTIGKRGSGQGEFNYPTYLWRDTDGRLYITDSLNFRIQIFASSGKFLRMFGHHGDATGDMSNPKGITVDKSGHIYVTDSMHNALQIFNENGELLLDIGNRGREPGEFWLPAGAFMTSDNRLYIADSYNQRIQVFHYLGDKP